MRSLRLFLLSPLPVAADDRIAVAALPALSRILSRARATTLAGTQLESLLLDSFGVERQRDWPVAPLSWVGEGGEPGESYWLRADPVHLRAERDVVLLVDAQHLTLDQPLADALVGALNAHFEADGLRFFAPDPARWYVAVGHVPDVATFPLRAAAGCNIDPLLPKGADALRWHRWSNEVQMLLHAHAANAEREAAGRLPVNGVWFWGGGVVPNTVRGAFTGVWGEDALARGLAFVSEIPWNSLPENADQWLIQATHGDHVLVIHPIGTDRARSLAQLEQSWFMPLLNALRARKLATLSVVVEHGDGAVRFDLRAADLWKFWRRSPVAAP